MNHPLVTIAIPTFNRANFIADAIASSLNQTCEDFELLIVDNASTDNTKEVIDSFSDPRIRYICNKDNIGILRNWNRCIESAKGRYLLILGDDDKLYPEFLKESVSVYDKYPNLGFIFSHCNKVDENGSFMRRWGYDFPPAGYIKGFDYLLLMIKYGCNLTNSSTTLIRADVFKTVGLFEKRFAANTFDFNMWIKIAEHFDVYFINKVLVDYRIHSNQVSELHWRRTKKQTGRTGSYLEIMRALAILLNSEYIHDKNNRELLSESLTDLTCNLSKELKTIIPEL